MKICHLLEDITIILNNEERLFVDKHHDLISLSSLDEHDTWIAQNLVRKHVYEITNSGKDLKLKNHANRKKTL